MGAGAGFHRHQTPRLAGDERQPLIPPQLLAKDPLARPLGAPRLEHRLGQIEPKYANFAQSPLLCSGAFQRLHIWRSTPSAGVHPIASGR
jgi:hypothetical protein